MKVIVYGLGVHFSKYEEFVLENFEVIGYIDKNREHPVLKKYELDDVKSILDDAKVMITSTAYFAEMMQELLEKGIGMQQICYMDSEIARKRLDKPFYSYSQFGEDYVIASLLGDVDYSKVKYLEMGVDNPIVGNNTYGLELRGATGWLVEANTQMIPCIELCRPNCEVLNRAVVLENDDREEVSFFVADNSALSSLDPNTVAENDGAVVREIVVKTITLKKLLDTIGDIDVLSVDLEGIDRELLLSTSFNGKGPKIICAETRETDVELVKHMEEESYTLEFMNGVNAIWKKK